MEVIHEEHGLVDVFRISGRLDYTATAGDFDRRLRSPMERDPQRRFPVLDLSGVTMLGSQALRGILALAKDLKGQSGKVFVSNPSTTAAEALKVSGFSQLKVYEEHPKLKDAVIAATLAARNAPALKTDDPFYVAPEPPPPPPEKKGLVQIITGTVSGIGKLWTGLAGGIQRLLDMGGKKKG